MTDGKLAHMSAARTDTASSRNWAAMREQVREIIRAEVGRLNPTDSARRPLELIIESSVRYTATDEPCRAFQVLRPMLLATTVAVSGWRNLMNGPAVLFWVLRDDPPKRR